MTTFSHTTVLLHPTVDALRVKEDGVYVDGTFGRGGHSSLILEKLGPNGRLIAFDRDLRAVEHAKTLNDPRLTIIHKQFSCMEQELEALGLMGKIDGILLDLGVSSPQLDDASRGFSFMHNGPLDMRMDQTQGMDARQYLYQTPEKEIAEVLWKFGEEKNSRQIARAIVALRDKVEFADFLPTTNDLVDLVKANSRHKDKNKNPATRTFQAIRIAINNELGELETVLDSSLRLLAPEGYISIISFHSLEDRIVKQFFAQHHKGREIPRNMPILDSQWDARIYYKEISKAIKPSEAEIEANPRSRSAILR